MRLSTISLLILLVATTISATAQSKRFISKDCGFRVAVPNGWTMKATDPKQCTFSLVSPEADNKKVEFSIKKDTVEQGEKDLGFEIDEGKWVLKGDQNADAESIDSPSWKGLIATLGQDESSSDSNHETRVLLTSLKGRIAEFIGHIGQDRLEGFVNGFEFLSEPAS